MQRLEWHCHTKSVSVTLYKAILCHGQSAGTEMANMHHYSVKTIVEIEVLSLEIGGKLSQKKTYHAVFLGL